MKKAREAGLFVSCGSGMAVVVDGLNLGRELTMERTVRKHEKMMLKSCCLCHDGAEVAESRLSIK